MTKAEYMVEALRTAGPLHERFLTEDAWRLTHAALGLVTEVGELNKAADRTNALEEIGDCLWFHNLALSVFPDLWEDKEYPSATQVANPQGQLEPLVVHFADLVKGHLFYGKDNAALMKTTLLMVEGLIDRLLTVYYDTTLTDVRAANIQKLRARYGGAEFSEEKALNRDLDIERRIMEGELQVKFVRNVTPEFVDGLDDVQGN